MVLALDMGGARAESAAGSGGWNGPHLPASKDMGTSASDIQKTKK